MIEVFYYGRPVGKVSRFLWRDGNRFLCRLTRVVIGNGTVKPYYSVFLAVCPIAGGALVSVSNFDLILRKKAPYVQLYLRSRQRRSDES
jgi:hypothetical protein